MKKLLAVLISLAMLACVLPAAMADEEPIHIKFWHTRGSGANYEVVQHSVNTFNETIGKAKGIRVTGSSQGTVNDLEANVMDAAEGKVGSAEMPTIFAAYADTAYKLDQMGMVVDLKDLPDRG